LLAPNIFSFVVVRYPGRELKGAKSGFAPCNWVRGIDVHLQYKLAWEVLWQLLDSYPYSRFSDYQVRHGVLLCATDGEAMQFRCQISPPRTHRLNF